MNAHRDCEIAQFAARLIVDEGMDWDTARRRALHGLDLSPRTSMPDNAAIEQAVREHIALYCGDTQPGELRALRELALLWMQRLAAFRPHLAGAVWRGTATRLSPVVLHLYCDDPKSAEIALIDHGVRYEVCRLHTQRGGSGARVDVDALILLSPCPALGQPVDVHLLVYDHHDLRGALRPDRQGRSWRGDLQALQALLAAEEENLS